MAAQSRRGLREGQFGLHIPTLGLPALCCPRAGARRGLLHLQSGTAPFVHSIRVTPLPSHSSSGLGSAARGSGASACMRALAWGEKLEVKCLKVRSLFSMNLLYLILSTNSNLIASGLKPLQ